MSGTIGRVDVAGAVVPRIRRLRGYPVCAGVFGRIRVVGRVGDDGRAGSSVAVVGRLVESFSALHLISSDFEMVAGEGAIRGEVAGIRRQAVRRRDPSRPADGGALDGGVLASIAEAATIACSDRARAARVFG